VLLCFLNHLHCRSIPATSWTPTASLVPFPCHFLSSLIHFPKHNLFTSRQCLPAEHLAAHTHCQKFSSSITPCAQLKTTRASFKYLFNSPAALKTQGIPISQDFLSNFSKHDALLHQLQQPKPFLACASHCRHLRGEPQQFPVCLEFHIERKSDGELSKGECFAPNDIRYSLQMGWEKPKLNNNKNKTMAEKEDQNTGR